MGIEFNQKDYANQLELRQTIKELETEINDKKDSINRLYDIKIDTQKGMIEKYEQDIKNKKYTAPNTIKNVKKMIENCKNTIETYIKAKEEDIKKIQELEKKLLELKNRKEEILGSDAFEVNEDGILTITDKSEIENINPNNNYVMVHSTNFFPKDKTILSKNDGNYIHENTIEHNGVKKNVRTLSHRHTVHFTINSTVITTGNTAVTGGTWKSPKFIIIEPVENHLNQFVVDPYSCTSDAFTYGSVKLVGKPMLLVREDVYNEIPKEELNNYNIIKYKGDPKACVDNILHMLGYKLRYGDPNAGIHEHSTEAHVEDILNFRDECINYFLDNQYDGRSDIEFTIDEINNLYEMYKEKNETISKSILGNNETSYIKKQIFEKKVYENISEDNDIPLSFVSFCADFGIYKNNDKYKMLNDEELYTLAKEAEKEDYETTINKLNTVIDVKNIYKDYLENEKSKELNKMFEEEEQKEISEKNITI